MRARNSVGSGMLLLLLLLYCFPRSGSKIRLLVLDSRELVVRLPISPRDARFVTNSLFVQIDGSGSVAKFRKEGDTWRPVPASVEFGAPLTAPVGASLVVSADSVWLWDPASSTLHPIFDPSLRSERVPLKRIEEVFVRRTQGGTPRDHGRIVKSGRGEIFERREFQPQGESTIIPAYLVHLGSGFQREDTLYTFLSAGYQRRVGGVMVCCTRPLIFSPQAHWALVGRGLVAFSSGDFGLLLLIPLDKQLPIDSIPLEIEPRPARDKDFRRYMVQQARATRGWSEGQVKRYSRQARRSKHYLRQQFSDRTPFVTQLFVAGEREVWVRHFDPGSWPHGLSDIWTIIDLDTRLTQVVRIPNMGFVHDLRRNGNQVSILSSIFISPGETLVQISKFDLDGSTSGQ